MAKAKIITVGSDPEFLIVDKDGHYISAEDIFGGGERDCEGCDPCANCGKSKCTGNRRVCGRCNDCTDECNDCSICDDCDNCRDADPGECDYCDDCMNGYDVTACFTAEIGCDGCSEVGELRPHYADTPQGHHDNIAKLIEQIDISEKYELRAGTYVDGFPLGGHIHLGIPLNRRNTKDRIVDRIPAQDAAAYLSKYAGMPLRRIEHEKDLSVRGFDGYGKFGSVTDRSYGLEWRMPASWLISSEITMSALCLAHVVAHEYVIEPKKIAVPSITAQQITLASTTFPARIINRLEQMKHYPKYRRELEPLFQMLMNGEKWNTNTDIRNEW